MYVLKISLYHDVVAFPFRWAFLEALGYFSFFGILLVNADSYRLELIMCLVTVLSISMFSYVLADLNQPFHGVFKVNLAPLFAISKTLQKRFVDFHISGCMKASAVATNEVV